MRQIFKSYISKQKFSVKWGDDYFELNIFQLVYLLFTSDVPKNYAVTTATFSDDKYH